MPENTQLEDFKNGQLAIKQVKEAYNSAKQASTVDFQRFARYYRLFRNQQTTKNYTGLANLFVPEPYRVIRKKTARLANAVRFIEAIPETANDIESAKLGTHLLNFLRRKLDWKVIERSAIQESRVIGLAWVKIIWQLDKEEEERPYKGFDLSMETADRVLLAPMTTMLDVFNGDIPYLIHEYDADIATLEKNPNYKKEAIATLKQRGGGKMDNTPLSQARQININQNAISKNKPKFRVQEYWGKYDGKNSLIVVADNSVLLRLDKNPYEDILNNPIPFVPFVANYIGKEMYPVGDIEPAESLFNELNDTRNQRMDTVTMNIDPPKIILKGAQIDKNQLVARRGWYIESSIPSGVQFIPPAMQGVAAAIEEEKAIRGDIQQVTGVLDFAPGSDVQAGVQIDTARGAIIAKGEADVITEDELDVLKISLRMMYRTVLAYSQAFLDREFVVRVFENGAEQFFNVDKNAIQGSFDLDIEMKTLQDKTTEQQLALMLFNQAKATPGANIGKFFTEMLEAFKENINIAEYYQEPQPQKEPPKVSISLRGELNELEVDEIYKMTGADPTAADPLARQSLREAMRGNLPEHLLKQVIPETTGGLP